MINLKADEIAGHFFGKLDAKIAHELMEGLKAVGVKVTLGVMDEEDHRAYGVSNSYRLDIKNKADGKKYSGVW